MVPIFLRGRMKREAQPLYREKGVADLAPVLEDFDQRMPDSKSAENAAMPATSAHGALSLVFIADVLCKERLFDPVRSFTIERKIGGVDCTRFAHGSLYLNQFGDA
jgi:hypothetical protein